MSDMVLYDNGKEIVAVPWKDIYGEKDNRDGSIQFKLFGGPCHGYLLRVYPPCDRIVLGDQVYELHPPPAGAKVGKNGKAKWCYVHNPQGSTHKMIQVQTLVLNRDPAG